MKVYTIATEVHNAMAEKYEYIIRKEGTYQIISNFPPVFNTKAKAENYLKTLADKANKAVVELELI